MKSWKPEDYGFMPWAIAPGLYFKGKWELRSFPNNMWLLRKKERNKGITKILIKFYYYIGSEDANFAKYLLLSNLEPNMTNPKAPLSNPKTSTKPVTNETGKKREKRAVLQDVPADTKRAASSNS